MIEGPDLYYPLQKANIDVGAVRAFNEQTCNKGKKNSLGHPKTISKNTQ